MRKPKLNPRSNNFYQKVYKLVRQIPKGKVATYGQIASWIQSSEYNLKSRITPRVVGFALHANKDTTVPCHRVVSRDGKVAENYAFAGWRQQKQKLVQEGVVFKDRLHVDLEQHLYKCKNDKVV